MKIGVNTWIWASPFKTADLHLLPGVKKMGCDVIEIALEDPSIIDALLLRKVAEDNGLTVTICGAFGPSRDISSDDGRIRQNGVAYIRDGIAFAEAVGSTLFSGPIYSAVGKTRLTTEYQKQQERAWCIENLRSVVRVAENAGVTIGIEPLNRFETDMINLVEQARDLVEEVGHSVFKIHIDTFHANIEEKSIPAAILSLGNSLLGHIHACENDRGTPGTGHVDWNGIRDALVEIDYRGAVVIESFTPGTVEIAKAASIWRPLAPSQDELARNGVQFLRNLLG